MVGRYWNPWTGLEVWTGSSMLPAPVVSSISRSGPDSYLEILVVCILATTPLLSANTNLSGNNLIKYILVTNYIVNCQLIYVRAGGIVGLKIRLSILYSK